MKSWVIWAPVFSVLGIFVARMLELRLNARQRPGKTVETRTFYTFFLAGVAMLGGGLLEYWWRQPPVGWWAFGLGWLLAICSFGIRWWTIRTLGAWWSLHVEIREEQPFIRSGPFRWVRHPAYLSMMLELLAGGLILCVRWMWSPVGLLFWYALRSRIRLEEKAMVEKFGDVYRNYQQTTPALVPGIFPTRS